ncbi:hypothetical protein BKA61DRAFT_582636 [Leptodontidium sp. MPI-SDFR-AT-0119]|nr:hypothetical protein BKA61DRAFT_582636 [Leptodontidium sp. MPI-SDFR-AT-0119]
MSGRFLQLGATFFFIVVVGCIAVPTSSFPTSTLSGISGPIVTTNIDDLQVQATRTISTSTSETLTPLYLNVTTSPPDPLGIENVSGIYGPGAWSAWFITGVAAWWRIITRSEKKIDVNTWVFLFGINWSAVDVFRTVYKLRSISTSDDRAEINKHMGQFGAAFTVLFWGSFHVLFQIPATSAVFEYSKCKRKRMATLIFGLVLPWIAILSSMYLFCSFGGSQAAFGKLPALYWRGMDDTSHDIYFVIASFTPILLSQPPIISVVSGSWTDIFIMRSERNLFLFPIAIMAGIGSLWILFILGFWLQMDIGLWCGVASLGVFVLCIPFLLPLVWMSFVGTVVGSYIWEAYFRRNRNAWISESCFFMPCAPQSIKEDDQIYPLIASVLLFVGLEVAPVALKNLRRRYGENRAFLRVVEGAFEMRRRVLSV